MTDEKWKPWKLTSLGMALVASTALVTGLVLASWNPAMETTMPAQGRAAVCQVAAAVPSAAEVEACDHQAKSQGDRTIERC
jgi:hypothetical protein